MIIAVASGKGGTGKTTISVALAQAASDRVALLDCDVEEPNAHIFLKLNDIRYEDVNVSVPNIDANRCTLCGKCSEICEFNAIAVLDKEAMIFTELCHSCGGCALICPSEAIFEKDSVIGKLKKADACGICFVEGRIDVGKALVPPVIREVKKRVNSEGLNIIDCPPGTACPAVTAMNGSDYIILVTEATPFGLHDLKLSVDVVNDLRISFGVIINKCDSGDYGVKEYCEEKSIDVLLEIPENIEIAKAYSRGESLIFAMPEMEKSFTNIIDRITGSVE